PFPTPWTRGTTSSGSPHFANSVLIRLATASVGTRAQPDCAINLAVSSSRLVPCSTQRTPAASPLRIPRQLCEWTVTYVLRASASTTAARIPPTVSWVSSTWSVSETPPPATRPPIQRPPPPNA